MTEFSLETALPLANAFNKGLDRERDEKDNQLFTADSEIKETRARVEAMSEHLKKQQER